MPPPKKDQRGLDSYGGLPYLLVMNNAMLRGAWARVDDRFVAEVRCGGRGEEMVGRMAVLMSRGKEWTTVTLGPVVKDWGKGDVVHFEVIR